ncbi:MAG TPA: hypothetical protein VID28_02390 [Methylomirabilota bacterium]
MARSKRAPGDALRDVPPREFVSARKALAARLAREGKTGEARLVSGLRRPSPVVWALNRTAVARPREIRALAAAVDRLRRAQLGRGDLRATGAEYRTAYDPLVRAAVDILKEAGAAVSPAVDRRIRSTLLAAATDRGLRADLEAGRLRAEHPDPGFAVLTGAPVPADFLRARPKTKAPPRAEAPGGPSERPRSSAREAAEARRVARRQARVTREAGRAERTRQRKAERAERAAARAERRVEGARRTLQALEARSAALRAAADEARREHAERGKIS